MTTNTLRTLPVPVVEPRPALRLVAGPVDGEGQDADSQDADGEGAWPGQGVLPLGLPDAGAGVLAATGGGGPHGWAGRFTQVVLEIAGGQRHPGQVRRWTSPEVQAELLHRHAAARRVGVYPHRTRVRSVHVSSPADGVAEVAAVVTDGRRCRALAFRMVAGGGAAGRTGRWRVTALEFG